MARGTPPLLVGSCGCVRACYVRFGIAVDISREEGKWELLESDSFIATVVCFVLLERQLFLALVFLSFCAFSSGWVGLKVGQKCWQMEEGWVFCSPLFRHVEIKASLLIKVRS